MKMRIKFFLFALLLGVLSLDSGHSSAKSLLDHQYPDDEVGLSSFFKESDEFFKKYVSDGKVDYKAIKNNSTDFNELIDASSLLPPSSDKNIEKAYWINMYNLLVIKSVIMNYPGITSPLKVDGFFSKKHFMVRGKLVSLDDIEKGNLLLVYKDARIHFVLVCAANGCPPLKRGAYFPSNIEKTLDEQTKEALNDPSFVKVNSGTATVELSELMKWYKDDFSNENRSIIDYINAYRVNKIPNGYKVGYYTYDWTLNKK